MKYVIFLGDGMADSPVAELGGKTPLMVAKKPGMDWIAREGRTGLFQTIAPGMMTGSSVANLSVLGYDAGAVFHGTEGRGVLEAASLGIGLGKDDLALRVNLISVEDGKIRSHSAGHISNEEAHALIRAAQEHFQSWPLSFHPGLSYRHVLVVPGGEYRLQTYPPHDNVGTPWRDLPIKPQDSLGPVAAEGRKTAELLNRVVEESQAFLENHPVNQRRRAEGRQPANLLWPWAPGKKPEMPTLQERFGIRGAAITAVDLIKGLAIYAGMRPVNVEGATGLFDTNFEGKADAALAALEEVDFVYIHVEAADEAGHERNLPLKIRCIEDLDRRLVQRVLAGVEEKGWDCTFAVLPDHTTPIALGNHGRDPVPVAIRFPHLAGDAVARYDEESVKGGALGFLAGAQFIETFFQRKA
ncbi:MAG: cofactor-independent phosphoglycerate mutase [Acidobacteriota bacterium]|jgi:2,3-bisphosphoglycerate-independent phosphoglycerate mutase|nr:cofactor-independent phosphoglycerate mutase [Acidobacteriota bacterium]